LTICRFFRPVKTSHTETDSCKRNRKKFDATETEDGQAASSCSQTVSQPWKRNRTESQDPKEKGPLPFILGPPALSTSAGKSLLPVVVSHVAPPGQIFTGVALHALFKNAFPVFQDNHSYSLIGRQDLLIESEPTTKRPSYHHWWLFKCTTTKYFVSFPPAWNARKTPPEVELLLHDWQVRQGQDIDQAGDSIQLQFITEPAIRAPSAASNNAQQREQFCDQEPVHPPAPYLMALPHDYAPQQLYAPSPAQWQQQIPQMPLYAQWQQPTPQLPITGAVPAFDGPYMAARYTYDDEDYHQPLDSVAAPVASTSRLLPVDTVFAADLAFLASMQYSDSS
jgi:hypothetical protein